MTGAEGAVGGYARLVLVKLIAAVAGPAALLLAAATPASAGEFETSGEFSKQTYRVPVTQPDETGRPVSLDVDVYLPERRASSPLRERCAGASVTSDEVWLVTAGVPFRLR